MKVTDIFENATLAAYDDKLKYCKRIVQAVMSVTSDRANLLDKEAEVLSVMCKLCIEGKEYMRSKQVLEEMEKCGVEVVGVGTLRNYRGKLKKKGWIEGKQLNGLLMKAIKDGAFCLGIFLNSATISSLSIIAFLFVTHLIPFVATSLSKSSPNLFFLNSIITSLLIFLSANNLSNVPSNRCNLAVILFASLVEIPSMTLAI